MSQSVSRLIIQVSTSHNVMSSLLVKFLVTSELPCLSVLRLPCLPPSFTTCVSAGDHVIIGSYDCRLSWFDLDLSTKPYRMLR